MIHNINNQLAYICSLPTFNLYWCNTIQFENMQHTVTFKTSGTTQSTAYHSRVNNLNPTALLHQDQQLKSSS